MDIRDFLKIPDEDLPEELFRLDVLDGSPPCSVFSMAGDRESGWNVEKTFREGQAKQRLDDLFFFFIKVAEKLKPKVVIAENVKGLITGNAKGWVNQISPVRTGIRQHVTAYQRIDEVDFGAENRPRRSSGAQVDDG